MKKFFSFLFILLLLLLLFFCGKKGPILPPIAKIPQKVEIFEAAQRGGRIILEWNNPTTYVNGSPLVEISEIEIWLLKERKKSTEGGETAGEKQLSLNEFEKKAELIATIKKEKFFEYQKKEKKETPRLHYFYKLTGEEFLSKKFTFSLRIKDRKNKESALSDLLSIEPKILPLPPQDMQSVVFKDRIEIKWNSPEKNINRSSPSNVKGYNIYRAEGEGSALRLNSTLLKETKYDDRNFLFEKIYRYFIRASATETSPFLESDDSEVLEVLAKDTFAPAVPSGLVSIAGENYVALSWNMNPEKDLAGYRVWRKEEGEEGYKLLTTEPIRENTYNDTKVEKNKRYYYAITALDKYGNESQKSEITSEIIKDISP